MKSRFIAGLAVAAAAMTFAGPAAAQKYDFKVQNDVVGSEPVAQPHPDRGERAEEQEMRDFLAASIAHFKIPRYIWFVNELPLTVTGKLQKFRMREMALERLGR